MTENKLKPIPGVKPFNYKLDEKYVTVGWAYTNQGTTQLSLYFVNVNHASKIDTYGKVGFAGENLIMKEAPISLWQQWAAKGGKFGAENEPVLLKLCDGINGGCTYCWGPGGKWSYRGHFWVDRVEHCCGVELKYEKWQAQPDLFPKAMDFIIAHPAIEQMVKVFPYGFFMQLVVGGVGTVDIEVFVLNEGAQPTVTSTQSPQGKFDGGLAVGWKKNEYIGAFNKTEFHGNGPISYNYAATHQPIVPYANRILLSPKRFYGDTVNLIPPATLYKLYHELEENVVISPPNETEYIEHAGAMINVIANTGRKVELFTVRDNNKTVDVKALADAGTDTNATKVDDSHYVYTYNDIQSDLFVNASAGMAEKDKDIPEGTTKTETFYCNDCAQQDYTIVDSNLTPGITASIAKVGTQGKLSIETALGTVHDSGLYVTVRVSGKTGYEDFKINLTVKDPPYAGTVWGEAGYLADISCICQDSNTGVYYAGTYTQKIYESNDLLQWTELPISGTFADSSGINTIKETKNYVVACTDNDIVSSPKASVSFSVDANLTAWDYVLFKNITPIPETDLVYIGIGINSAKEWVVDIANPTSGAYAIQQHPHLNGWVNDGIAIDNNIAIFAEGASGYSMIDRTIDQCSTDPTAEVLSISADGNAVAGLASDERDPDVFFALVSGPNVNEKWLYKTTDQGSTWAKISSANCDASFARGFAWGGGNALSAGGLANKMLYSLDNGVSWGESLSYIDGLCMEIIRNKEGYLVAITSGSTKNVYISEA